MKKENNGQKIKCDVEACIHQDHDHSCCDLKEIRVGCECDPNDADKIKDTVCESFENSSD